MPERDKFTWNTMIFAYSCSGRLADAKQLFLRNPIKNTISWSALISGYCKYGSEEEAFDASLKLNNSLGPWHVRGITLHGLLRSLATLETDLRTRRLFKDFATARALLQDMEVDDVVSWNSMVVECIREGLKEEALSLFGRMHERDMKIDDFTIPSILNLLLEQKRI
ncbi:hypothetical protein YC2023_078143 [Brassica napus]